MDLLQANSKIHAAENLNNSSQVKTLNQSEGSENIVEQLVSKPGNNQSHLNNLYENIGTRVSKLREINEGYQKKIKDQETQIKLLDERIETKRNFLENEMRGKGEGKKGIMIQCPEWVNKTYTDLLEKNEMKMKINQNHIQNDPALKKLYQQKESELSQLKNHLNSLLKKTDHIKNEINVLRIDNNKHRSNLNIILAKKGIQDKEMEKISLEANSYLKEKGNINEELIKLNDKIDSGKTEHEGKMQELSKMIDNTKKIKEFHETLAIEKFANNAFRKANFTGNNNNNTSSSQPSNKIAEEKAKLALLHQELEKKKRLTVYLIFSKLILLKKQQELNKIIEKVKKETGIGDLDKLSSDLQLSTKTNRVFESDLTTLNEQKQQLEKNIEDIKMEIQNAQCVLNDTSTRKAEYIEKLSKDLAVEEETKMKLSKRLFALNRMIDLMSKGFKSICEKLNFFDKSLKFDSENSNEATLNRCMEFLERKMIEIIQLNSDPLNSNIAENEEAKNIAMLEKIPSSLFSEESKKLIDMKKLNSSNFTLKDIKDLAKDMVNNYIKKYDKVSI